jgi:glycine cleavage system transcriptional repressor
MKRFLLTAAGRDRPGLVAAVSKVLFDKGCNLEDSAMTRLQGEFAILLIFTSDVGETGLARALRALGRKTGLITHLKVLSQKEARPPAAPTQRLLVSLYGADQPGLVYRATQLIAKAKVNISDVSTHRTTGKGASGFILFIEGEPPKGLTAAALERQLRAGLASTGVTLRVKPIAASAL